MKSETFVDLGNSDTPPAMLGSANSAQAVAKP